jgi:hypothetical protein
MGFRLNSQVAVEWKQWIASHREELLRCGIPDEILRHESRWRHFREHGFDPESDWHVRLLSETEQQLLRSLLIREYGDSVAKACLGPLGT